MTALPWACNACGVATTRSVAFLDNDRTQVTSGWCGKAQCGVEIVEREAQLLAPNPARDGAAVKP